ncbi:MAG: hypothetical protein ACRDS0_35915, partial [Pseudonocardiaceae bacterium]
NPHEANCTDDQAESTSAMEFIEDTRCLRLRARQPQGLGLSLVGCRGASHESAVQIRLLIRLLEVLV